MCHIKVLWWHTPSSLQPRSHDHAGPLYQHCCWKTALWPSWFGWFGRADHTNYRMSQSAAAVQIYCLSGGLHASETTLNNSLGCRRFALACANTMPCWRYLMRADSYTEGWKILEWSEWLFIELLLSGNFKQLGCSITASLIKHSACHCWWRNLDTYAIAQWADKTCSGMTCDSPVRLSENQHQTLMTCSLLQRRLGPSMPSGQQTGRLVTWTFRIYAVERFEDPAIDVKYVWVH